LELELKTVNPNLTNEQISLFPLLKDNIKLFAPFVYKNQKLYFQSNIGAAHILVGGLLCLSLLRAVEAPPKNYLPVHSITLWVKTSIALHPTN
jgi:hypothetical protein